MSTAGAFISGMIAGPLILAVGFLVWFGWRLNKDEEEELKKAERVNKSNTEVAQKPKPQA